MKKSTLRKYGSVVPPHVGRPFPGPLPPVPLSTDSPEATQRKIIARLKVQVARSIDRWHNAREKYGPSHARTLAAARRNSRVARLYAASHQQELPLDPTGPCSATAPLQNQKCPGSE